jgi:hypothetical protein
MQTARRAQLLFTWIWWLQGVAPAVEFTHCFDLDPDQVILHIDSQPGLPSDAYAILDTGSSFMVVDDSCKSLLKGEYRPYQINLTLGTMNLWMRETCSFSAEGFPISAGLDCAAIDLSNLREASGINIIGVIGYPSLSKKIIDFDNDSRLVRIDDHLPPEIDLSTFSKWNFMVDHGRIFLMLKIPHCDDGLIKVMVDSGTEDVIDLPKEAFSKLAHDGFIRENEINIRFEQANGIAVSQRGNSIGDFLIGGTNFNRCEIKVADRAAIGMGFIKYFHFIIDYPNKVIYLKKLVNHPNYQAPVHSGLELHFLHQSIYLKAVEGSDAWNSGVIDGSRLMEINGHPVHNLTENKIYNMYKYYYKSTVTLKVIDLNNHEQLIALHGPTPPKS